MGLKEVLINLNDLKVIGIIGDYAIGGGYAVKFYDVPLFTYDLDVLVVLSSDNDYHQLYEYFRNKGFKIEDVYIFIEDMPVQFLPNYISPLFNDAIEKATTVELEGVYSKFVSVEYLILLLLTSFRSKDKIRIQSLIERSDNNLLLSLIKRFDDEASKLHKRYKEILART